MFTDDIRTMIPYDGRVTTDVHTVDILFTKPVEILDIHYLMQDTYVDQDLMEFDTVNEEFYWKAHPGEVAFTYVDHIGEKQQIYPLDWYVLSYRHEFTTTSMDEVHVRYNTEDEEGEIVERIWIFDLKLEG